MAIARSEVRCEYIIPWGYGDKRYPREPSQCSKSGVVRPCGKRLCWKHKAEGEEKK